MMRLMASVLDVQLMITHGLCFQVPDAGRSLFSINGGFFGIGLMYASSADLGLVS